MHSQSFLIFRIAFLSHKLTPYCPFRFLIWFSLSFNPINTFVYLFFNLPSPSNSIRKIIVLWLSLYPFIGHLTAHFGFKSLSFGFCLYSFAFLCDLKPSQTAQESKKFTNSLTLCLLWAGDAGGKVKTNFIFPREMSLFCVSFLLAFKSMNGFSRSHMYFVEHHQALKLLTKIK